MAEAAWWSPSSLAVADKKGHAHVLRLVLEDEQEDKTVAAVAAASLRFRPLLSTDMPIGRGMYGKNRLLSILPPFYT